VSPRRGAAALVSALVLATSGGAVVATTAARAASATASTTSSNWAGYAARRSGVTFRAASATWTVPAVDCDTTTNSYSANWVGLGGYASGSQALEQLGTESDCSRSGKATYSAWFEVVPAAATTSKLTVKAGETVHATVSVKDKVVTMTIKNLTRGTSQTKVVHASAVDLTSAEWIVEAPSLCSGATTSDATCRQTALADFGTTGFTAAKAVTTGGHAGAIVDDAWTTVGITLRSRATGGPGVLRGREDFGGAASGGAAPGALDATGGAFAVDYAQG
jgi:hypothetical protein